jgi:hypothetical protein
MRDLLLRPVPEATAFVGHLCGARRCGRPAPNCACCGTLLLCIFSLDGSDPLLAGTTLPQEPRDYDFFVCPACPGYEDEVYVQFLADGTCRVQAKFQDQAIAKMVVPYTVLAVEVIEIPQPSPETLDDLEAIRMIDGGLHRISDALGWGTPLSELECPSCGGEMPRAMVIDSDGRIPLQRDDNGKIMKVSLNWIDGDVLSVGWCRACDCWGYVPAR